MPDMVIIEGVPPHDGEYEIDLASINMEEFHLVKRMTGIVAGEIEDALMRIDTDVFVGLAAVVIQRSGKRITTNVENQLWKAPLGALKVRLEPDPPATSQETPMSSSDELDQPSEATGSSGSGGKDDSATVEEDSPPATGQQASGLSVISGQESSAA